MAQKDKVSIFYKNSKGKEACNVAGRGIARRGATVKAREGIRI